MVTDRSGNVLGKLVVPLVLLGVLGGVAFAFLPGGGDSPTAGMTQMTHVVSRGDLVVSATEVGSMESAGNEEIKCKVRGGSTILWVIEAGTEVKPGDELVRLDASVLEDSINTQKIAYQTALATHAQSVSDVGIAKIAITEYIEGTFRSAVKTKQKDLAVAESNLRSSQDTLEYSRRMFRKGYNTALEIESKVFSVKQAQLELEVLQTDIDVLERFTKVKMLEELRSTLKSKEAKLAADTAALDLEKTRLDREEQALEYCVIVAESSGMVIYPRRRRRSREPEIEEGAQVREDQTLLLIPDLNNMQVKVGIHESKIGLVKPGMPARVMLQDETKDKAYAGEVLSVASIAETAQWWNGNVVNYDAIIKLNDTKDLKPGMSAEVEVILGRYENVLKLPVKAVLEEHGEFFCWVRTTGEAQRRALKLGASNDQFIVVESGLDEGDEVVEDPLAFIEEAQKEALKPISETLLDASTTGFNDDASGTGDEQSAVEKNAGSGKKPADGKRTGNGDSNEQKDSGKP